MRRSNCSLASLTLLLIAVVGSVGCSDTDILDTNLNTDQLADVAASTRAVAVAGPSAAAAGSMIDGMMRLVQPSSRAPGDPTCPSTFDLGNGVSGTCSASGSVATFSFGGTLGIDGAAVSLSGSFVVTAVANQPASGSSYTVAFDATASGPRGDVSWGVSGTITKDDAGNVVDFSFAMNVMVTPTGGASSGVIVAVDANRFELVVTGPFGGILLFELDRSALTGRVLLNGIFVADLTIGNGCATLEYVVPGVSDEVVCSAGSSGS